MFSTTIYHSVRDTLKSASVWLADGTFKSAPPPFAQIYIIFAQVVSLFDCFDPSYGAMV